MRHRKRGRKLGRDPSHRRAMLRNLASSLFLTERDAEFENNAPVVRGRVVTTLQKAKEARPLVEKCITIARRSLGAMDEAEKYGTIAERNTESWKSWRQSDQWQRWNHAIAPVVAARRRALRLLGDKQAVRILFDEIAPRFADRNGGYTRVLRLAKPRLGDAGTRAILEFVGEHDRVTQKSVAPAFDRDDDEALDKTSTSGTGTATARGEESAPIEETDSDVTNKGNADAEDQKPDDKV